MSSEELAILFADYDESPLPKEFGIHADNALTWAVFAALGTQWTTAIGFTAAVRTGLKYEAIPLVMAMLGVPRQARPGTFRELRQMENAALEVFAQKVKARS